MLRAISWDNDGVLVDTERLYYDATREALGRADFSAAHAVLSSVRHVVREIRGLMENGDK